MRNLFSYSLLLAALLFVTSCNDSDDWDLPKGYTFATVMEDAEDESIYFMMDNSQSFVVENNKTTVDIENLEVGTRVVAGVTLFNDASALYDYAADLYVLYKVIMGENVVVDTESESDSIADDEMAYLYNNISLTRGYLNLLAGFRTDNYDDVSFYLVENLVDSADDTDDGYLYLELRYDNGSGDNVTTTGYESYISFDMESYRDRLEDMTGVKLRVKTTKSGTITITVDSSDLYPEND